MKSAAIKDWLARIELALDTEFTNKTVMVRAYAAFYTMVLSVDNQTQDQYQYTDPTILRIYRKFASPANRALSFICRSSFHRPYEGDGRVESEFRKLGELIDR